MINMGMSTSSATPITTTAAIAPGGQSVKRKKIDILSYYIMHVLFCHDIF